MPARPTLRDIAARVGCAKATVCLALKDDPRLTATTRRKVQLVAKELGYRPDPVLSQIAMQRWRGTAPRGSVMAFVTTNHPLLRQPLDHAAIGGARARAFEMGYLVEHFCFEEYRESHRLARVLRNRGIRGVILGQVMQAGVLQGFPWEDFVVVACNNGFYRPPVNLITYDHARAMVDAWRTAEDRGYKRIGVAIFDESMAIDEFDRTSAALYCQQHYTRRRKIPRLHFKPGDARAIATWARTHRPDVILGFNESVYGHLREKGFRVPEELGFAALMVDTSNPNSQSISGIEYDPAVLGAFAVEHLDGRLRSNRVGLPERLQVVHVRSRWHEGTSLPTKPGAGRPLEAGPQRSVRGFRKAATV
ncbi:MAG: LacI family DNA-binding transcriptional regulator [Opitutaceae bacterium]|nr:LacI family DNA-binding transcriptional regulator [Opitutaceae bacterium]